MSLCMVGWMGEHTQGRMLLGLHKGTLVLVGSLGIHTWVFEEDMKWLG